MRADAGDLDDYTGVLYPPGGLPISPHIGISGDPSLLWAGRDLRACAVSQSSSVREYSAAVAQSPKNQRRNFSFCLHGRPADPMHSNALPRPGRSVAKTPHNWSGWTSDVEQIPGMGGYGDPAESPSALPWTSSGQWFRSSRTARVSPRRFVGLTPGSMPPGGFFAMESAATGAS